MHEVMLRCVMGPRWTQISAEPSPIMKAVSVVITTTRKEIQKQVIELQNATVMAES